MATYYVATDGSNAAAGTSWATRWLTVGKALGASGIASGDTVYIAPGTYREAVSVAMTSATVDTYVIGDVDGSHTSGTAGPIIMTGHATSWTTASTSLSALALSTRDFLRFQHIIFVSSGSAVIMSGNAGSVNNQFEDCAFLCSGSVAANSYAVDITTSAGVAANWTFDRCYFNHNNNYHGAGAMVIIRLARHTADYDANILIRNCIFDGAMASSSCYTVSTGSGVGFGGGVDMLNCTLYGEGGTVSCEDANLSTTFPSTVYNCVVGCHGTTFYATTLGQLVEDYNVVRGSTLRTNVSIGANTVSTYNIITSFGQEAITGESPRPWGTPVASSPILSFALTGAPSVDFVNRPRPTTFGAGALWRHDTAAKETTVALSGASIKLTGYADQDFWIPVRPALTTITITVQYDSTHATTNPPQAILLADNSVGVTGETKTAAAATDTWETLTFTPFTPTAVGVIVLRLVSRGASNLGSAYFDSVMVKS